MPLLVTASTARPVGVLPAVPAIAATCVVVKRRAGRDGVSPRPKSEREARRRAASLAGRGALSLPQPHHAPPPLAWLTPFRPGRRHPRVAPAPLPLSRSPPSLSPPPTTQPPPRRPGRPARLHPGPPCPRRHRRLGRQVPGLRLLPRGSGRGRVPGEDARVRCGGETQESEREARPRAPLLSSMLATPISHPPAHTLFSLSPLLQARRRPQRGLLLPGQGQLGPA